MAIPNLVGLLLLTPVVVSETKQYFEKIKGRKEAATLKPSAASQTEK